MTPITEDLLRQDGWEVAVRERGYVFLDIWWNKFQRLRITYDITRKQWRIHYNHNDTDIAFMEDIATITELWGHTSNGVLNLMQREFNQNPI